MLTAVLFSIVTLSSCSDFLEIEPQNEITADNFWDEKSDIDQILMGCYARMASNEVISRMIVWGEFRSDNVEFSGSANDDLDLQHVLKEAITANNGFTYWKDFYEIINRCNVLIENAPLVAKADPSYKPTQMKADVAEATAIRSLMYFYLIRTFRDVPYSEEAFIDDGQELVVQPTPFSDLLDKLIASLEAIKNDALTAYPKTSLEYSSKFNTARITRWGIYSMLCEMYLWKGDYQQSVSYADLVINHYKETAKDTKDITAEDLATFNGYPLIGTKLSQANTYGRAFNYIFVEGNSVESIFEITFVKGSDDKQLSNVPFSNYYGGDGRTPMVKYSEFVSDKKAMEEANKEHDARFYEDICFDQEGNPSYVNKTTAMSSVLIKGTDEFKKNSSWGSQYPTAGEKHDSRSKANVIIYRLSDVMLMQAEAYCQMIQTDSLKNDKDVEYRDKAFAIVDAINKRSLMEQELKNTLVIDKYTTKELITNLVMEERQRELMFEGKRYYDLVRRAMREGNTEYLRIACMKKNSNLTSTISNMFKNKMDAIFWPYNLDETKVNHYLKEHQNSAFGSGENSNIEKSK